VAREALRLAWARRNAAAVRPAPKAWASSAGRLKFACTLLDDGAIRCRPRARLALTGSAHEARAHRFRAAQPAPHAVPRPPAGPGRVVRCCCALSRWPSCGWKPANRARSTAELARAAGARAARRHVGAGRCARRWRAHQRAQADAVNAAVMQLNLPWRALHDAVAAATPASIALLALEPDARKRACASPPSAKQRRHGRLRRKLQAAGAGSAAWRWCATKSTSRIRTGRCASSSTRTWKRHERHEGGLVLRLRLALLRADAGLRGGRAVCWRRVGAGAWLTLHARQRPGRSDAREAAGRAPPRAVAAAAPPRPTENLAAFYGRWASALRRAAGQDPVRAGREAGLSLRQGEYKPAYDRNARCTPTRSTCR
jgi:hypothetical protein